MDWSGPSSTQEQTAKVSKNLKMSSQDPHAALATVDVKVQAQKVAQDSFACEVYKESTVLNQGEL